MSGSGPSLFHERQRFTQPWMWVLLVATGVPVAALGAWLVRGGTTVGWWAIGMALLAPVLLALLVLDTEVRADGLHLRFLPFVRHRHLRPEEIAQAAARSYRPIAEYGGWGVRRGRGGTCYTVSADRGVQLVLAGGKRLLVGSQRPEELAAAVGAGRGGAAGGKAGTQATVPANRGVQLVLAVQEPAWRLAMGQRARIRAGVGSRRQGATGADGG